MYLPFVEPLVDFHFLTLANRVVMNIAEQVCHMLSRPLEKFQEVV